MEEALALRGPPTNPQWGNRFHDDRVPMIRLRLGTRGAGMHFEGYAMKKKSRGGEPNAEQRRRNNQIVDRRTEDKGSRSLVEEGTSGLESRERGEPDDS